MTYNFDNYKDEPLTRPRDIAWSNWMKWEKVGDKISGFIVDVFYRKAEGEFKEQRGITLKTLKGELINVGIKRVPFVLAQTDDKRLGDPLTIIYEKDLPPRQKGYKPVKQFGFYCKNLEENAGNKTVRELEKEDMERQELADDTEDGDDFEVPPEDKE